METNEKNKLLDELSVSYNRANYLAVLCNEKNKKPEAVQAERRKKRLKGEIDGLLRDIYLAWIGDANVLRDKITTNNDEIDKCIQKIQSDVDTAQNIVKAIGYLDDIIAIAAALVP
jgi:hypothetical protein